MPATATQIQTLQLTAKAEITAKSGERKLPVLKIIANTGEPMKIDGFFDPVVIDLEGVEIENSVIPIIADHDTALRIGHSTKIDVTPEGIFVAGIVSSTMGIAQGIVSDSTNGFPFQASVGSTIEESSFVESGSETIVNDKTFQGPLIVAKRVKLKEISITVLGADTNSSVSITAKNPSLNNGVNTMPNSSTVVNSADSIQAERSRIQAINTLLTPPKSGWNGVESSVEEIRASAIAGDIPLADIPQRVTTLIELQAFRNALPSPSSDYASQFSGQSTQIRAGLTNSNVLEAALSSHVNLPKIENHYDPRTLEAASHLQITSLLDAMKIECQRSGKHVNFKSKDAVIKAAFSSADFTNLLSNVAGKQSEIAYNAVPSASRIIAKKLSASDFKQKTGIRLTGNATFDKHPPSGEIKHGNLEDQSYTYSVDTYTKMFGIDRTSIINDDLNALDDLPKVLGRGAATALEETFWTLVLANTGSYFHANNSNLITGAGSALSGTSLGNAVQLFLEQKDTQGKPVNVVPSWLVVSPALKVVGDELFVSRTLNVGGGSTTVDDKLAQENVLFGKYEPIVSPWLGAQGGLVGGNDTQWYLFGNPNDIPAFGIVYLDNSEFPTIEQQDAQFNLLGIQWRGVFDFSVAQIDHRGGVKSDGA